jgi:hypothetical protein
VWLISLAIMIVMSCLSFIIEAINIYGIESTTVHSAARMWSLNRTGNSTFHYIYNLFIMFGLPLISALIFSDEILSTRINHASQFILVRLQRGKYYISTIIVSMINSFLAVSISLILNQLFWLICCPLTSNQPLTQIITTDFEASYLLIFKDEFFNYPYIYNMIYILMISFLAGIIAFFASSLCFVLKKRIHVLIIPTMIYLAENFISAAVGYYRFSIVETISPMPAVKYLTIDTYILFASVIFILSIFFCIYGIKIKKDEFE